jgi:hypothetical protein
VIRGSSLRDGCVDRRTGYTEAKWVEGMHLTPAGADEQAVLYADFLTEQKLLP